MLKCLFFRDDKYIGFMYALPRCGEDFCDDCGDCLACYADDPCPYSNTGLHLWVKYVDSIEEAQKIAKEYNSSFTISDGGKA